MDVDPQQNIVQGDNGVTLGGFAAPTAPVVPILPAAHPPMPAVMGGQRLRVTVVCGECKRLKLRCDRRTPCSACIKRGVMTRCVYAIPPRTTPPETNVQALENAVLQVPAQIAQFQEAVRVHNALAAVTTAPNANVQHDEVNGLEEQINAINLGAVGDPSANDHV
ncbi:hypothetical protein BD410DRAFT_827835 [Rickenella mellea]|uniref:Zn(2)-C6 fungal-type domain-containing protein n=1 Tax=Rickenella mellea TaxID=50990 RepID=A0A4Y7Q7D7_9AGAM|nr:hypothetical protein BD410DRAFT_827835 [Rickenella mellea]